MMEYCPPNVTLSQVWVNDGISQCLMDTGTTSVIAGFLIIFGLIQIIMYKRNAIKVVEVKVLKLFNVQMVLMLYLPALAVTRFVLHAFVYNGGHIYGYMIVNVLITLVMFPLSAYLTVLERRFLLPPEPPRRHGFVLLMFWTMIFVSENLAFININKEGWWWHLKNVQDRLEMSLFVGRYVSSLLLLILGFKAPGIVHHFQYSKVDDESKNVPSQTENGPKPRNVLAKLRMLLPYLWPKGNILLQINVIICMLLLAGDRVLNLMVPLYNKKIVDSLTAQPLQFRWDLVVIYMFFKFLQGAASQGLLSSMQSCLWTKVQHYTSRELQLKLFDHLHSLSLRWHLSRKTGEVLRVIDRGTGCIDGLLYHCLFSIIPTVFDIVVAFIYFVTHFNLWFALILITSMFLYLIVTFKITEWGIQNQTRLNEADNNQYSSSVDSLLNYETVKYYGAEDYEHKCYKENIINYQKEKFKSEITQSMMDAIQNIILCMGLLASTLVAVYMVVNSEILTVGDYVFFTSYIMQLYSPLNWLGYQYRSVQRDFADMDNMFDLLSEESEVKDSEGAQPLVVRRAGIEFKNVSFGYEPERLVLKNVSFQVAPGSTVALVGPSGAGKSTIMRLVFRFYDASVGAVSVDSQDVRAVTQASLRASIGVVPQDTVLFNNTVRYNIQYGKLSAPEEDVIAAAKNADINDRILTFPDAYDTQVGERGLKLSGGEKQRIAIARTLLKNPAIVLLDEATSALDTNTERNIQAALVRVCANRTTLIIAHRLSTIIHADQIFVMKEGEIVERGNHETLLELEGLYASMWHQQLENRKNNGNNDKVDNNQPDTESESKDD